MVKKYDAYRQAYPELAAELERRLAGRLSEGWDEGLPTFGPPTPRPRRAASGKVLNANRAEAARACCERDADTSPRS